MHYEKFADGAVKCIEDEIPFELPDGWAQERLRSIADMALFPARIDPHDFPAFGSGQKKQADLSVQETKPFQQWNAVLATPSH